MTTESFVAQPIDFDALERRGHQLTLVAPTAAGLSPYVCENCQTFVLVDRGIVVVWHHPRRRGLDCEPRAAESETLYSKLLKLQFKAFERMSS